MTNACILPLSSPLATLERVGGKGANLAELVRAGFSVPPAFLVTTTAYRAFVDANDLQSRIVAVARGAASAAAAQEASDEIGMWFERGAIPPEIEFAIGRAYADLSRGNAGAVAIRSSATAEDLPGLSFAGQQDTYLNVVGREAVISAVKRCWASLWTARVIGYRAHNGIDAGSVSLAVVVQRMAQADSAGVLFTANPLTGHRFETVIDASFGLGETIVSGQVDPDHFVVARREWRIVERKRGAKAIAIRSQAGGGTHVDAGDAEAWSLSDTHVLELARLGQHVADHFGAPQDIEWARVGDHFLLLQSRPITSLYPLPERPDPRESFGGGTRLYFSFNAAQGVIDPLTPLGIDVLRLVLGPAARRLGIRRSIEQALPAAGDRLYVDVTDLVRDPRLRRVYVTALSAADPASRPTVLRLANQGRIVTCRVLTPHRVVTLLGGLRPFIARALGTARDPKLSEVAQHEAEVFLERARRDATSATDLPSTLDRLRADAEQAFEQLLGKVMSTALPGLLAMRLIESWLVKWLNEPRGGVLPLARSLPNNVTTSMDLELWSVAKSIQADPESRLIMSTRSTPELVEAYRGQILPPPAQAAVASFLQHYGMRGPVEIDIGRPRWRDDPTAVFETLRGYLSISDPDAAPDVLFARGAREADRAACDYAALIRRKPFGAIRARAFQAAYGRMRALAGLRETPKLLLVRLFGIHREALIEHGRELASRGAIERADDIFFVPFVTLQSFAAGMSTDLREVVAAQRATYDAEGRRRQMPRLMLSDGEAFYGDLTPGAEANQLRGQAVSPGLAEGAVRVVFDPREARLEPGEILVCPATDPSWTPLFLTAAGLVMEMGGMMTHGSVVAREYGIPAVVGLPQATTRLRTGQRVRVDGEHGIVVLLDGPGGDFTGHSSHAGRLRSPS
jgi:pyruvate,water dikinase